MKSAYLFILGTVLLTVYGQLVIKWRVDEAGSLPGESSERLRYALDFVTDPWVVSVVVSVLLAAACWVLAIGSLELSRAYPLMSASFVLVVLLSAVFFAEPVTAAKLVGVFLIMAGLAIGTQT